jgi:hypothetical protein
MAANHFKVDGKRVDSLSEFTRCEDGSEFNKIQFFPNEFKSDNRHPLMMKGKKFIAVSFKDTDFVNVRFINCTFDKCLFIGATVTDCEFTNCKFTDTNTSKMKIKNCLIDPVIFDDNFDLEVDSNIAIDLYHSLYKNSSESHQPEYAIESLYRMKVAERKQLDSKRKRSLIDERTYRKEKLKHIISDFVSGYGLRVGKVLRFLVIVIASFTILNYALRSFIFEKWECFTLIDAFYFTCVTITTLGYGDISPETQIGKLFIVIQALTGFVVISLFLSAVANRALRSK